MTESFVEKFCVIYDGKNHEHHEMDIGTFSNSLNALSKILKEASLIVNGTQETVEVLITSDFIKGSFGFEVELLHHFSGFKDILIQIGLLAGGGNNSYKCYQTVERF